MNMNQYSQSVLHQMEVAITSIIEIMDCLTDEDLTKRPTPSKHSIGELLSHIALICKADYLIAGGAGQEEMDAYYSEKILLNLPEMRKELIHNFRNLREEISGLTDDLLTVETKSHWGVTYTKFEWLVEIVAHLYHHRGQLHAMLVNCYDRDLRVSLFE
jgi:uncharacterized damage-inducible protein DinB